MNAMQYALVREAKKRMTPDEFNMACRLAEDANKKVPGAEGILWDLVSKVLFHSEREVVPEPVMVHKALE